MLKFPPLSSVRAETTRGEAWYASADAVNTQTAVASALGGRLGGAVSENGCLCQREGGHGGGSRRRSVLMLPMLLRSSSGLSRGARKSTSGPSSAMCP